MKKTNIHQWRNEYTISGTSMQQNVIQNIKKGKQILSYATTDKSQGHYSNELCQAQNTRHTVYDFIHPKNL